MRLERGRGSHPRIISPGLTFLSWHGRRPCLKRMCLQLLWYICVVSFPTHVRWLGTGVYYSVHFYLYTFYSLYFALLFFYNTVHSFHQTYCMFCCCCMFASFVLSLRVCCKYSSTMYECSCKCVCVFFFTNNNIYLIWRYLSHETMPPQLL